METVKCSDEWKEMKSKISTSLIVGGKVVAHSCLNKFENIFKKRSFLNTLARFLPPPPPQ
jgi:hypothetical protein